MSEVQWKDATSYSQGERGTVPPRSWAATFGDVKVLIMSGHTFHKPNWVMKCERISGDQLVEIARPGTDLAEVKATALTVVETALREKIAYLQASHLLIARAKGSDAIAAITALEPKP